MTSIVSPRHSEAAREVLRSNDIQIRRRPVERYHDRSSARFIYDSLFKRHPIRAPELVDGIIDTYSTARGSLNATHLPLGQRPPEDVFRLVPPWSDGGSTGDTSAGAWTTLLRPTRTHTCRHTSTTSPTSNRWTGFGTCLIISVAVVMKV